MTPARKVWLMFAVVSVLVVLSLQWLSADLTFVSDDWSILSERSLDLNSLLTPYNEHLSLIPIALMVTLRDTIGLGSHPIYLLLVQLFHTTVAAGILAIGLRYRSAGPALGLAVLGLLLGPGAENLMWAFQAGAVISTAAGVWALVFLDRPRPRIWVSAGLLGVAMASSSFGVPFAVAAGALAVLRRDRPGVIALIVVGAVYGAWYLMFRMQSPGLCSASSAAALVLTSGPFVFAGLTYAVGAPLGLGLDTQPLMAVAAVAAASWLTVIVVGIWSGAKPWLPVASVAGLVAMAVLVGWNRGCLGIQIAGAPRYGLRRRDAGIGWHRGNSVSRSTQGAKLLPSDHGRRTWATGLVVVSLHVRAVTAAHVQIPSSTSRIVRAAVEVGMSPSGPACHTDPIRTDSITAVIFHVPSPTWVLRTWLVSAHELDPPAWVATDWAPSAALVAQVRQIMCETPAESAP